MGVTSGDGPLVHALMSAIGPVVGGPQSVVAALLRAVGCDGLLTMPGFSTDAYFPAHLDPAEMTSAG